MMRCNYLIPSLFLAACAPETGIWLLEIDTSDSVSCEETLTHNFINVLSPTKEDDDPNWTQEESSSASPALGFVQVEMGSGSNCVMLWGNQVMPGTCSGGEWSFEWERQDTGSSSNVHALGYTFSHDYDYTNVARLTLNMASSSGSGKFKNETSTIDSYIESDMWAEAVGVSDGQMPASSYLQTGTFDSEGNPVLETVYNTRADSECAASECTLDAAVTCATPEQTVRAYHYVFGEEPNYDNMRESSQDAGFAP